MEAIGELSTTRSMKSGNDETEVDGRLWESLRTGNVSVFEAIFKAHYGFLLNYGLRLREDEDEIKDCIQILFVTLWERREYLGDTTSIRNYLTASLRRLILKRLRAQVGRVELDSETFHLEMELSVEARLILDQSDTDTIALLHKSIQKLPERQKEALYLKYFGDRTFAEIATVMNITTRAVYKLIYKALDGLNEEINPNRKG